MSKEKTNKTLTYIVKKVYYPIYNLIFLDMGASELHLFSGMEAMDGVGVPDSIMSGLLRMKTGSEGKERWRVKNLRLKFNMDLILSRFMEERGCFPVPGELIPFILESNNIDPKKCDLGRYNEDLKILDYTSEPPVISEVKILKAKGKTTSKVSVLLKNEQQGRISGLFKGVNLDLGDLSVGLETKKSPEKTVNYQVSAESALDKKVKKSGGKVRTKKQAQETAGKIKTLLQSIDLEFPKVVVDTEAEFKAGVEKIVKNKGVGAFVHNPLDSNKYDFGAQKSIDQNNIYEGFNPALLSRANGYNAGSNMLN